MGPSPAIPSTQPPGVPRGSRRATPRLGHIHLSCERCRSCEGLDGPWPTHSVVRSARPPLVSPMTTITKRAKLAGEADQAFSTGSRVSINDKRRLKSATLAQVQTAWP
eukprot:12442254-Alexandrium_andersonii.AAC.1